MLIAVATLAAGLLLARLSTSVPRLPLTSMVRLFVVLAPAKITRAVSAELVTWTTTLVEAFSGTRAPKTVTLVMAEAATPESVYEKLPLTSFSPPNWVVLAMRSMASISESTWSWSAASSSSPMAPELAEWLIRARMSSSRLEISLRAPSAVEMTLLARVEFSTAWLIPRISLRRVSEAMSPAGSSRPRVIRRPVLRRSRRMPRSKLFWSSRCLAWIEGTLVLIRLMASSLTVGAGILSCTPGTQPCIPDAGP